MTTLDKENFYNSFKDGMLCNKICNKKSREYCCPELLGTLCKSKRQLLEEMIECDKTLRAGKDYEFKEV